MNVKKNPVYYVNVGIFLVLAVYSLLVCINAFDSKNIDMNAGLCAVITAMVVALLMYLLQATRLALVLYSSPLAKTTLEIISVLIFLTLACVIRIYCVGEFEIIILREGIVLGCMFMAYLIARMLNQFGFITLLALMPWPYMVYTYGLSMSELIVMAEIMAGMLLITFILYMVRQRGKFKLALMSVFVVAVVWGLSYVVSSQGYQSVAVDNYKQYLELFNDALEFGGTERFYYIAIIMAAILGAARMWLGKGNGNTLMVFAANAALGVMIVYGVGGQYMYMMYLLFAIISSGAFGTRPAYMDEEVKLNDNIDNVSAKRKKKENVEYVDDSELDKMLDELEADKPYGTGGGAFNPIKFAAEAEKKDEEVPIELQMYDFGAGEAVQSLSENVNLKKEEPVEEKNSEESVEEETAEDEILEEVAVDENIEEAAEEVVEEILNEEPESEDVEEAVEVIDEVEMTEADIVEEISEEAVMEEVSDDEVLNMIVDEVEISEVEISEVEIQEEPATAETGNLTESEEFEMPVFEMDSSMIFESVVDSEQEDYNEEMSSDVVEDIEEVNVDDSVSLVVTDENAESISDVEEFSMPTFEMDTVALDGVQEMFVDEKSEDVVEPAQEYAEEVEEVEEVQEELIVSAEDAVSISAAEDFSVPTFEMSSDIDTEDVLDEIVSTEAVEETVAEEVENIQEQEDPVVLVQNPIFIRNPINFNRTRGYESQSIENKDYGFVQSAPTFETMGSFLADNKENSFPQFEATQSAMDDFISSFVDEAEEKDAVVESEVVTEEETIEEFDNFASISIDVNDDSDDDFIEVSNNSETEAVGVFEYATEETGFVNDIEMPDFMGAALEAGDLFGTFSIDDDDDFEESATEEIIIEPESVDLGLDLGEDFSFGQAQSLTDLYDYDSAPQTFAFEEVVEEAESEVEEVIENVEETSAEAVDEDVYSYDDETEEAEDVPEVVASVKNDDVYDWDAAEVYFEEEQSDDEVETVAVTKSNDSDFFDWNSVDTYEYEDEEAEVVETTEAEPVVSSNAFEEFVWTDEMVSEFASEEVEEIKDASEEVATSMEYDYSEELTEYEETVVAEPEYTMPEDDEPAQYEVFQSSGNFTPEEEIVEDTPQYEVFQSSGNFTPEVEDVVEETQYEVFQSSGNFQSETEEEVEDTPQYEVFQSSGNFQPETEEVVEETQYEVFQSSGNFEPETEEIEEVTMYKTYGEEDEEEKTDSKESVKKEDKDLDGFSLDFPDFDLDLPDF